MALPTSYLTSTKKLGGILDAIRTAQAPKIFTLSFLESLGFTSSSDRLIVAVLKALGFLDAKGAPTNRYYEFLDQTQSSRVMAEAMRDAYADLFQINKNAQNLSTAELKNKFKTLSQGQVSDSVLDKMAATFKALVQHADFDAPGPREEPVDVGTDREDGARLGDLQDRGVRMGGLVYNIQLVLPESRDRAVYDAFFRSLRDHLM